MAYDLLIHGGRVVTPVETIKADIAIDNGKILGIGDRKFMTGARRELEIGRASCRERV